MAQAQVKWNAKPFMKKVGKAIVKELVEAGAVAVADIKRSMKSGSSAPGQPPGVDTGLLKRSLKFDVDPEKLVVTIGVEDGVPYDLALEFGYPPRNLQPRPYLRPGLKRAKRRLQKKAQRVGRNVREK